MLGSHALLPFVLLASLCGFAQQPASPPDLTPDKDGKLSQEAMRDLTRVVAEHYLDNFKKRQNYTFLEHDVEHNLNGDGQIKSTETSTYEILRIYGEPVRRLIEKNDEPLDAKEAAKEDAKLQKIIDKRKNETDEDRRKRQEKEAKQREEDLKFVRQVADTHNFKFVATEQIDGRDTWVIDGDPLPGAQTEDADAKFVSKFRGRLWIDKTDLQLTKMDVEAVDTVSIGWLLARFHKGTRLMVEQTRVNDDVWMPRHVSFKLNARVALLKGYNIDNDQTYRDYKKFRTSTKILSVGEVKEPESQEPEIKDSH
jgi:hypothetical protein